MPSEFVIDEATEREQRGNSSHEEECDKTMSEDGAAFIDDGASESEEPQQCKRTAFPPPNRRNRKRNRRPSVMAGRQRLRKAPSSSANESEEEAMPTEMGEDPQLELNVNTGAEENNNYDEEFGSEISESELKTTILKYQAEQQPDPRGAIGAEREEGESPADCDRNWAPFITPPQPVGTQAEIEAADDADWERWQRKFEPLTKTGHLTMRQFYAPQEKRRPDRNDADFLEHEYICKLPGLNELLGKTLMIVSETGTRKSYFMRMFIKEQCEGKNIVFVSCRVSHANNAHAELKGYGFDVYNQQGDVEPARAQSSSNTTRIVVQAAPPPTPHDTVHVELCSAREPCLLCRITPCRLMASYGRSTALDASLIS